jgi:hypothetical protein
MQHVNFFSWGYSNFPQGEGHQKSEWKALVVHIIAFLLSVEEQELLLCEEGAGTLRRVQWGVLGLCMK